jgi:hypothetical protein
MKSYRKELWFNVPGRRAFINITPQVQECLRESGIREGLCLDNAPKHHTPHFHQRRRRPLGRLHNRTGQGCRRPPEAQRNSSSCA